MGNPALRSLSGLFVCVMLLSACGSRATPTEESSPTTLPRTTTTTLPTGPPPELQLTDIGTFDRPTAFAQREGSDDLYVAEQSGKVVLFRNGAVQSLPVLDLTAQTRSEQEGQGLLGLAFAPEGETFYVYFTETGGSIRVLEYELGEDGTASLGTQRELLRIAQNPIGHNGGQLTFGPDGYLYIGTGDGSGTSDTVNNAQNLTLLSGKILRIDPTPTTDLSYTVPFDNPFTKQTGARGEVWAFGVRNPRTFSFSEDGALWLADNGPNYEEVNTIPRDRTGGQNYGWPLREAGQRVTADLPTNGVDPVYSYDHGENRCAVVGGSAYSGKAIADLTGRYLSADRCTGQFTALTLRGTEWEHDRLNIELTGVVNIVVDHDGELYAISNAGRIVKVVAA